MMQNQDSTGFDCDASTLTGAFAQLKAGEAGGRRKVFVARNLFEQGIETGGIGSEEEDPARGLQQMGQIPGTAPAVSPKAKVP